MDTMETNAQEPPLTVIISPSPDRTVPAYNWRAHWLTVQEFSRMMGREPQTVYKWIRNNTLSEFGVPVMHFRNGKQHSGRVFILNIY
jgi:hypothetical protein